MSVRRRLSFCFDVGADWAYISKTHLAMSANALNADEHPNVSVTSTAITEATAVEASTTAQAPHHPGSPTIVQAAATAEANTAVDTSTTVGTPTPRACGQNTST